MLVEALFWFHPMVWWIGGRLVDERERACDEAVVGSGHDPAVYARGLLECCRLFLQSPLRCVAGASGSNLSRRVEMIMTLPHRSPLSRQGKALLVAAGICALASPVAAGWLTSPAMRQVAAQAVALASRPASALIHQPSASASTPDNGEAADTIVAARPDATRAARVQRIAALHLQPLRLDTGAERQPRSQLAEPLLSATTANIPDARLVPAADVRVPQATSPPADAGGQPKKVCMTVRVLQPSPYVTHLCLTRNDWKKIGVYRQCWPGRYGCTPEQDNYSGDPGFPGPSTFSNTNANGMTGGGLPTIPGSPY
jgi:hypothetical protein